MDEFAKQLAYRLKYGHYIQWNYEREKHRMRNDEIGAMYVASDEDYKAIRNFTEETNQLEQDMQQLEQALTTATNESKANEAKATELEKALGEEKVKGEQGLSFYKNAMSLR